jgi:hypothetical protein
MIYVSTLKWDKTNQFNYVEVNLNFYQGRQKFKGHNLKIFSVFL